MPLIKKVASYRVYALLRTKDYTRNALVHVLVSGALELADVCSETLGICFSFALVLLERP